MFKLITSIAVALYTLAGCALAEPMKLTVNQAYSVSVGIAALDRGYADWAKDTGKDVVLHRPFALAASVRVALAIDAERIEAAIGPDQKALKSAREKIGPPDAKLDAEQRKALDDEAEKIGARVLEIDLTPISEGDLALDKNAGIGPGTLRALSPIIKRAN